MLYPLSRINRLAINSSFLTSSWITRSLIIFSVAGNLQSCATLSESCHSRVEPAALCANWQPRKHWQSKKPIFPLPGTSASLALPVVLLCCLKNTYSDRGLLVLQAAHIEKQKDSERRFIPNPLYLMGDLWQEICTECRKLAISDKHCVHYRLVLNCFSVEQRLGEGMILFLDRVTELLFTRRKKNTKTKTPCNVPLAIGA